MLSEEQQTIRRLTREFWTLPPRRRLWFLLREGFITDEDAVQFPRQVLARAFERRVDNGDLCDLEAAIRREKNESL